MKRPDDIPQEDLSDPNQKALDEAVLRLLRAGTHDIVKVGTVPPWMEHVPDGEGAWGYPVAWSWTAASSLPVDMFTVTDAKSGKRRADCKVCYNERQRTRYVRAGYKIVTIEVLDGDPCVGHPCPKCGQPFEPGQHIQGENVQHADCRMARLESGAGPTPALCRECGGPYMAEDEGHQFCSEECVAARMTRQQGSNDGQSDTSLADGPSTLPEPTIGAERS